MQILKLGGSVVTHKDKDYTEHSENIKRLAKEIAEASSFPLIIVHGGGSFGHPHAKKHGIADGFSESTQLLGFSGTHQAMMRLNKIIVDALLEQGVPAFSLSVSSMLKTDGKRLNELDTGILKSFIETGLTPVLYGDAVLDSEQGFAILSGDQLTAKLAIELKPENVIFGSDVDGIYTENPKNHPNPKFLKTISINNVSANVGDTTHTDVTGGMEGKLSEASTIVRNGSTVIIINASKPNRVKNALLGETVIGTKLTL